MMMKESNLKSDPTMSSFLAERLNLQEIKPLGKEGATHIDSESGERFYSMEIRKHTDFNPPRERFAVLLLKGIIPVADIIEKEVGNGQKMYFSHEQNFKNIVPILGSLEKNVLIDCFILKIIFADPDHGIYIETVNNRSEQRYCNVAVDKKSGKYYFFDLNRVFEYRSISAQDKTQNKLKEKIISELEAISDEESLLKIKNKLEHLRDRCFNQEDNSFFYTVLKKAGVEDGTLLADYDEDDIKPKDRAQYIFNETISRIQLVLQIIDDKLKEKLTIKLKEQSVIYSLRKKLGLII